MKLTEKNRMDAFGIRGMKSEMLKGERTNTGKRNWQKAKQNWVNEDGRGGGRERERQTTRMQTFNNANILFLLVQGVR